jgi:hypothetical protein
MPTDKLTEIEIDTFASLDEVEQGDWRRSPIDYEPDHKPRPTKTEPWEPDLNPTQKLAFDDPTKFILMAGEKFSGKSIGAEHKLVRHCYENWDALGLVFTPSIRTGKFGVMADLETLILPSWEEGIGLEWKPSRLDPSTKDRVMKVGNRFGGWSTILQISIPYEEAIASRIKGVAPSFILGDELTDCDGRKYFSTMVSQLGRRRNITGPQQFVGTCNPKGPSNWVYKVWFEEPVDHVTGVSNPNFKVYHVPFTENSHRPEATEYIATLLEAVRYDPIEKARLVDGKWIEMPTGDSLFREHFKSTEHVVGNSALGTGIVPNPAFPCYVGYDLGQVYSAAVFLQLVPTNQGDVWTVFDEIVHLREKILYKNMAKEVVDQMLLWNKALGRNLAWEHIADDSAINQWRPGSGSYDAWEFEREFNKAALVHGLQEMRMIGCPKGPGSVGARTRIGKALLMADRILISDICDRVKDMFLMIESEKDDPTKPKKTVAGHIHVWDALSYPLLKYELKGGASVGPAVLSFSQGR